MATNTTGFLLMAGLGALLFLGRRPGTKTTDEDSRLLVTPGRGGSLPMAGAAFNLQSYVDGLFGDMGGLFDEMATVPVEPAMGFFYPANVVVTSSGVPGSSVVAPELVTVTTKSQIGGDGGETIVASSLAILQQEQLDKQRLQTAANVQTPKTEATAAFYRDEEARQRAIADSLIKARIAEQAKRNAVVVARTRLQQENIARGLNFDGSVKTLPAGMSVIGDIPPTINMDQADDDEWELDPFGTPGQSISVPGKAELNVDFTPQYSESFVISGGMDSPGFASEDEQLYQTTVHEITASYDIGF